MSSPRVLLSTAFSLGILLLAGQGEAKVNQICPAAVTAAVEKAYPQSKVSSCKRDRIQYEVKVDRKSAQALNIDVSEKGSIIQTREKVDVNSIPKSVVSAFQSKYHKQKILGAEKLTKPNGSIRYEVAYKKMLLRHQALFDSKGTYLGKA